MNRKTGRRTAGLFLLAVLFLAGLTGTVFAGEGVPIYTFSYQGAKIETYATYSVVDGVQTQGFRYFVKDGELVVINNRLNAVPDGIFLHFENGESYEAVLTRGGKLVSLGTVNLTKTLENLRNTGISGLVSNIETGGTDLILIYSNGAVVCYDAVSGKEQYRVGSFEDEKPGMKEFVQEYLDDIVSRSTGTDHSQGKVEAEAVVDIMNKKGLKLNELVDAGVFTDENSLNRFVASGELPAENPAAAAGQTEPEGSVSGNEADGTGGLEKENGVPQGENTERAEPYGEEMPGAGIRPSAAGQAPQTTTAARPSSEEASKAADDKAKSVLDRSGEAAKKEAESIAADRKKAEELQKKEEIKRQSGSKENGAGEKTPGGNDGTGKAGETKENAAGAKEGTDEAGGKTNFGRESTPASEQKGKGSDAEAESGGAAGAAGETRDPDTETKGGETHPVMQEEWTESAEDGTGGREDAGEKEKNGGGSGGNSESRLMQSGNGVKYISVYNPDTGSYEIFAVDELLNHPEEPKSENEKLDQNDNKKIAELLKGREDETEEQGIGLYLIIILAVAGLMVLAMLAVKKSHAQKTDPDAEQDEQTDDETILQEERK